MFEGDFPNQITTVVFSRCTMAHLSKAYKYPGSGFSKQTLLQFQSMMVPLQAKASKLVLPHGGEMMYGSFATIWFPLPFGVATRPSQMIIQNALTRLEIIAEVCEGMTSQDMWQEEANRFGKLKWCRPTFIRSNHALMVKTKLEKEVRPKLQDTVDECQFYRGSQKAGYLRGHDEQVFPTCRRNFFNS